MAVDIKDVSTLTVAGTSIGLSSASPTKAAAFTSGARQALIIVQGAPCYYRGDGDAATSDDVLLNVGDCLPILSDNANKTLDNLRFIRKTSTSATLQIIWYNREAILSERIIRGAVRLVTEAGDSLADDTADAIKVRLLDSAGTAIEKAEDAAHTSGDKGIVALGVRDDTGKPLAGTDGDYALIQINRHGGVRVGKPMFGRPYLRAEGNGNAKWERADTAGAMQSGVFGWRPRLFGGTQTGSDWAGLEIPVDDMPLSKLDSIAIVYEDELDETYSIGVMITICDPNERDSRAEVSLYTGATGGHTPPPSAIGKNYYEVLPASTGYFWYGENCTGAVLTQGLPNIYTIAQFQADAAFSTYVITKIEINVGWAGSGTCDDTWVEAVTINGEPIPLVPPVEEFSWISNLKTVSITKVLVAASAYDAADVLSESATNGVGTGWTFTALGQANGGKGYITKAHILSETTAITPRLVLYLFKATPTCELDDHAANTALLWADLANYIGRIDFPALSENGTGAAEAIATPSTYGNLPLAFECAQNDDNIYGVLVTLDAFTQDAGDDMTIALTTERG